MTFSVGDHVLIVNNYVWRGRVGIIDQITQDGAYFMVLLTNNTTSTACRPDGLTKISEQEYLAALILES